MNKRVEGFHSLIVGLTRSGKSHFVKKEVLKGKDRIVVFDPDDEWGRERGFHTITCGSNVSVAMEELRQVLNDNWDSSFKVVFVPLPGQEIQLLHEVSGLLMKFQTPFFDGTHDLLVDFVVDEIADSCKTHMKEEFNGFLRVARRGAKRGINAIMITQRPQEVNSTAKGQARRIISFGLSDDNALEAVEKPMRAYGAKNNEIKAQIGALKQYEKLFWELGTVRILPPSA